MFPTMHVRSVSVLDRPRLLLESERSLIHPALRPQVSGGGSIGCGLGQGNDTRVASVMNSLPVSANCTMTPGGSSLQVRPMFQGLPLSSVTSNGLSLNVNMLSAMTNLAAVSGSVSSVPGALPSPLFQYPGIFPSPDELKYLSIAQIQAANQAHLAGEVAKRKPPFLTRNYLELAMLVCNTFRGKLFPCPHCRYVTDRRNNLKRHVATMHQACDKQLECCGVTFSTKASLREHITIFHHNGYSCPFCGRRFCRKALLKRHLSVHSGQKDYTCPSCDYATSHKSNLERHKRIHARLQILGPAGLEDAERSDFKIFKENDACIGNSLRDDVSQKERQIRSNLASAFGGIPNSWSDREAGECSRVSNNSDDQEDCEIDIDDNDDDDDDDSDIIIDTCSDDNNSFSIAAVSSSLCLNVAPEVSNIPINLVTASNSRASAAATMTARLTNGFVAFPVSSNPAPAPISQKQSG